MTGFHSSGPLPNGGARGKTLKLLYETVKASVRCVCVSHSTFSSIAVKLVGKDQNGFLFNLRIDGYNRNNASGLDVLIGILTRFLCGD